MTVTHQFSLYAFLARFELLKKSYVAKIMLVAFLGTHVPLLTLLLSFLSSTPQTSNMTVQVLFVALLATLGGTAFTLYGLRRLLMPVILTSTALKGYFNSQKLPDLPTEFVDEAGTLMANTSQTLHQLDELIHYISSYDDLTGLAKRNLLCDRLYEFQLHSQTTPHPVALFVVGIDDFSGISHTQKPETVNVLLRSVARRLLSYVSHTDYLAKLNEDEFAIALIQVPALENLIKQAETLLNTLADPFEDSLHITASVGIAIDTLKDRDSIDQLLQQAHITLHTAKQQGRSQYQFYSPGLTVQLQDRLRLENELYGALDRNEMQVYYQPLIDLHSGEITATEALLRWQHPTLGLITPDKFIPIAEANGFIMPLGEWVLQTACAQNQAWQLAGFSSLRISVNLSARQLQQPNLVDKIKQILADTGLQSTYLELEMTESALMVDIQQSILTLKQLRELGISLALDDFGTGYSSLSYLKQFPVNMLKIDQSFMQDVLSDTDSIAVTNAIIALSNSLDLKTTAEGVETQEQLDYLKTQGCDEGQGFYFSHPSPAETITQKLKTRVKQMQII